MFTGSSAEPLARTQHLLEAVSKVIDRLPNRISISGHTDSVAPGKPGYSNWDLSADRANAARRILEKSGVEGDRIYQVSGKGDREPLYPDDPDLPANRRISIVIMNKRTEEAILADGKQVEIEDAQGLEGAALPAQPARAAAR